ncbi:MAG: AAA family ATPase [Candidatus Melainabacteria bacterium]|nr:AAA family ATPase [Candidatus Melainabacteria bacterium]
MVKLSPASHGLLSYPRNLIAASLLGLTTLQGCNKKDNAEIQTAPQTQVNNEVIKDDIPDKDGLFLSTVDQVLAKAKLGKITKAQLWISTDERQTTTAYYEFILKNKSSVYLTMPTDTKEVEKLEQGLRTLSPEPVLITKGEKSRITAIMDRVTPVAPSLVAVILILILYRYFKHLSSGGKDGFKPVKSDTRFKDVRGYPNIIKRLEKIVKYIKDADENKVEAQLPKGILLIGGPGIGKTLLARAVAGESGVPFIPVSASKFIKMFAGLGAVQIDNLFDEADKVAKKEGHCIIFIDEIDAIGGKRSNSASGSTDSSREYTQAINQLLNRMDGFKPNDRITVMAATNRPDTLDDALTRPGRFDMIIEIPPLISSSQREDVLDKYLSRKQEKGLLAEDVDIKWLADNTEGFSGAQLENLIKQAAIIAFENNQSLITKENFKSAITEISIGMESGAQVKDRDLKVIARHEPAGHGILALACKRNIETISNIPRGRSLGHVMISGGLYSKILPAKAELLESLLILMGGRAAELELLPRNSETTGAKGDYKEARDIIRLLLSSAMFEGHISSDYTDPQVELSDKDSEFMNQILDRALLTSRQIIKQVPKDKLEDLVKEYLGLKGELKGEEAQALYDKHLQNVDRENIYQLVQGFIDNPGGIIR